MRTSKIAIIIGTLMTIIGAYMWYATAYGSTAISGASTAWLILIIGIVVWVYGDYKAGIYRR